MAAQESTTRLRASIRGSSGPVGRAALAAAYRPWWSLTNVRIACAPRARASVPDRPWMASRMASAHWFMARMAIRWARSVWPVTCLYSEGVLIPSRSATRPMPSWSNPTSSTRAAAASVTAAAVSPALGTAGRLGQERQGQCEDLVGGLGVRVVAGAVDHGQLTEAGGQVGDDLRPFGAGVGPVGVQAAFDDQDRAGDVGELGSGVGGLGLAHGLQGLHPAGL